MKEKKTSVKSLSHQRNIHVITRNPPSVIRITTVVTNCLDKFNQYAFTFNFLEVESIKSIDDYATMMSIALHINNNWEKNDWQASRIFYNKI